MDYFDKYMKMNALSAKMTGYFAAKAQWDTSIPVQARKEMLENLIYMWEGTEPDCDIVQTWIEGWKKEIQNLSA
jgi:hypothetical protein